MEFKEGWDTKNPKTAPEMQTTSVVFFNKEGKKISGLSIINQEIPAPKKIENLINPKVDLTITPLPSLKLEVPPII